MRDIILQDLIKNIFPDSLTDTIAWAATRHGWISKKIMLQERSQAHRRLHSIWSHLYDDQEQAKQIYDSRSHVWHLERGEKAWLERPKLYKAYQTKWILCVLWYVKSDF